MIEVTVEYSNEPPPAWFKEKVDEVLKPFDGWLGYTEQGVGPRAGAKELQGMIFVSVKDRKDKDAARQALKGCRAVVRRHRVPDDRGNAAT